MSMTTDRPSFPPLFRGEALRAGLDPLDKAVTMGMREADPGLIVWSEDIGSMRAAVLLAPETPLADAAGVAFAALLGVSVSFGALAPPEVAVHFDWPFGIRVNGARCGQVRVAASTADPEQTPDWLAIAIDVPVLPVAIEPGEDPDRTTLHDEGCAEIEAQRLIEAWSRHMLVWINRFVDDGLAPLHAAWRDKCDKLGEQVSAPAEGVFVGMDELGGMLLKTPEGTRAIPLTEMLEAAR